MKVMKDLSGELCKENIKINGIIVDINEYGRTEKIERLNLHISI